MESASDEILVAGIPVDKIEAFVFAKLQQAVLPVYEVVEDRHVISGTEQMLAEYGPEVTGASGYQYVRWHFPSFWNVNIGQYFESRHELPPGGGKFFRP
jgi:hypothetical protein